jgi:hypothetical protein
MGLVNAGLSQFVKRVSDDSMTGGLSSMDLLRFLIRDMRDARLDGRDLDGALTLGSCSRECRLSSQTLRSELSVSMAQFLASLQNGSSIAQSAVGDFLTRVAMRHGDLFPDDGGQDTYDVPPTEPPDTTPPVIAVTESKAEDEAGLTASVTLSGTGYANFSGTVRDEPLKPGVTASFSRYASHYGPSDSGIPKWRFQVTDDRTAAKDIHAEARLVRSSDGGVLVPWKDVAFLDGAGYNHEVVVSSDLHPDIALLSDTYRLDVRATDQSGNASTTSVTWQQTILTPPVRQRAGSPCDAGFDGGCAAHYSLQGSLDAAVAITGAGLPTGWLQMGHLFIDNPNPVPVRVSIAASASITWSRGRKGWVNCYNNAWSFTSGCHPNQLNDGTCYNPPTEGVEDIIGGATIPSVPTGVHAYMGSSEVGLCAGCDVNEREIPASSTVEVWIQSAPYTFLWAPYAPTRLSNPNLPSTAIGSPAEQWIKWFTGGELYCQTWWYLTRLAVTPTVYTTLTSRPADSRTTLAPAAGTDTANFTAGASSWSTSAPGEPAF